MQAEYLFLRLRIVSPVHLGSAEVYEPTSFYLDDSTSELVHFDLGLFVEMLDDEKRKKLSQICRQGTPASIIQLMKFVNETAKGIGIEGERILVCRGLMEHYSQTSRIGLHDSRRLKNEISKFQIMRTAHDPVTQQAYIPGSAIKGAIRTAILNHRRNNAKGIRFTGRNAGQKLQEKILGYEFRNLASDPFRLVKVSDFFPIGEATRKIVYAVNKKKRPSRFASRAPYQILETIQPGSEFMGIVTVYQPTDDKGTIKEPVTAQEIKKALGGFYEAERKREERELPTIGIATPKISQLPIRIGRHSGAESVTVEGFRHIKIMKGRNRQDEYLDHATTVWVSSESRNPSTTDRLAPFGWANLEELDSASWKEFRTKLDSSLMKLYEEAEKRFRKIEEAEKEAALRRAEEERRLEEKRRREADPAFQRKKKFEEFISSLPDVAHFPGQAAAIIDGIAAEKDEKLANQMIAEVKQRYKKQIKKAKKNKKKWAKKLTELGG